MATWLLLREAVKGTEADRKMERWQPDDFSIREKRCQNFNRLRIGCRAKLRHNDLLIGDHEIAITGWQTRFAEVNRVRQRQRDQSNITLTRRSQSRLQIVKVLPEPGSLRIVRIVGPRINDSGIVSNRASWSMWPSVSSPSMASPLNQTTDTEPKFSISVSSICSSE